MHSALDPIVCPTMEAAMVNAIAVLGILSIAMKGHGQLQTPERTSWCAPATPQEGCLPPSPVVQWLPSSRAGAVVAGISQVQFVQGQLGQQSQQVGTSASYQLVAVKPWRQGAEHHSLPGKTAQVGTGHFPTTHR